MTKQLATIKKITQVQPHTRIFYMTTQEELGFVGGNWIMLDPGIVLKNGQTAKRAYSIMSSDSDQKNFIIAIKLLPQGTASNHIYAEAKVGSQFKISGPYGKDFRIHETDPISPIVIIATDTGITAALGIALSKASQPYIEKNIKLLWFVESDSYFLDFDFVKKQVPEKIRNNFRIHKIAGTNTPEERSIQANHIFQNSLSGLVYPKKLKDALFFLSGDKTILSAFEKVLLEDGVGREKIRMDVFFDTAKKQ